MKPSQEPHLDVGETDEEVDAGWGDPETASPSVPAPSAPPVASVATRSVPSSSPAPVDDLDDGWGDEDEDDEREDARPADEVDTAIAVPVPQVTRPAWSKPPNPRDSDRAQKAERAA